MHILCTYSFGRLNDQYFYFHYFLHPVDLDLGIDIGICVPWQPHLALNAGRTIFIPRITHVTQENEYPFEMQGSN